VRRRVAGFVVPALVVAGAFIARSAAFATPRSLSPFPFVRVGELVRTFRYYAPPGLKPRAPLVILFHESRFDAQWIRQVTGYEFEELAQRHGFVIAYPDGHNASWNDCRRQTAYPARARNVDDEGFVRAIVARLSADVGIDPQRVFVAGYSDGAQLAFRLALEAPDLVAGVAAVAANLPTADNTACRPTNRPVPVLIIDGTDDPISPFRGGEVSVRGVHSGEMVVSTADTAAYFVRIDGQRDPKTTRLPHVEPADPTFVERTTWAAPGHAEVVLDVVHGGGHVIPGKKSPMQFGRVTRDLDGPAEIWSFFSRQPARPAR
jgi:polyhydroxybutyrate depolymerase